MTTGFEEEYDEAEEDMGGNIGIVLAQRERFNGDDDNRWTLAYGSRFPFFFNLVLFLFSRSLPKKIIPNSPGVALFVHSVAQCDKLSYKTAIISFFIYVNLILIIINNKIYKF